MISTTLNYRSIVGTDSYQFFKGDTISIDASATLDQDGDAIQVSWSLQKPVNSATSIVNQSDRKAQFVADAYGEYYITLTTKDAKSASTKLLTIFVYNVDPIANAGSNRDVIVNNKSVLDGSKSSDLFNDTLSYLWRLEEKPSGSHVSTNDIVNQSASKALFTPDIVGIYKFTLAVSDGSHSKEASVLINARSISLQVPDSGQVASFTSTYGEDADYIINPPAVIDKANGTISDVKTGLLWQKNNDGNKYNWYQASGVSHANYNPAGAFLDVCGSLTLGGYSDWRVPTIYELMTVADFSSSGGFVWNNNTASGDSYWSQTPYAIAGVGDANGWSLGAWPNTAPSVVRGGKDTPEKVLCVHGTQLPRSDLVDNADGTVTDFSTGLVWQSSDDKATRTWEQAVSYCEGMTLSDRVDWRLPNIKELQTIIDYSKFGNAIRSDLFKLSTTFPDVTNYWSSTSDLPPNQGYARTAQFFEGWVNSHDKKLGYYALCVRSGI